MKKYYIVVILLCIAKPIFADINVGSNQRYTTIQDAIDASRSGDTINVYDGIYNEAIDISTPNIKIKSVNEWGAIIDGDQFQRLGCI